MAEVILVDFGTSNRAATKQSGDSFSARKGFRSGLEVNSCSSEDVLGWYLAFE